jgi:hypothetical protein
MSNDPASGGEQHGRHGQVPYPGAYGQHPDPSAYPGAYGSHAEQPGSVYPGYPVTQQAGYGQSPPPWAAQQSLPQHPGYPGAPGGPAGLGTGSGAGLPNADARTFFGALFDLSFRTFATPVITRVMFILGLVGIVGLYLVYVIFFFTLSGGAGMIALLLGAVIVLFAVMGLRAALEFNYAVVQIAEDVKAMRDRPSSH